MAPSQGAVDPVCSRLPGTHQGFPPIDADALTALKFANCLPHALAQQMLQQRVLDEPALRGTLREPCRFVSS